MRTSYSYRSQEWYTNITGADPLWLHAPVDAETENIRFTESSLAEYELVCDRDGRDEDGGKDPFGDDGDDAPQTKPKGKRKGGREGK